jgi:hypothetical protein
MPVSNCCSAPFIIGYKEDGERCSACKEHCGEEHILDGSLTKHKLQTAIDMLGKTRTPKGEVMKIYPIGQYE